MQRIHFNFFPHITLNESKKIPSDFYGQLDEKVHLRNLAVGGEISLITQALQKYVAAFTLLWE